MSLPPLPLSFGEVDKLAFAAARGKLAPALAAAANEYAVEALGPLIELSYISGSAKNRELFDTVVGRGGLREFLNRLHSSQQTWVCRKNNLMGFYRTERTEAEGDGWTAFLLAARRATNLAGLPQREGAQVVAAMRELRGNIDEHSKALETGIVAFKGDPGGRFEFVVADRGVGLLDSLRTSSEYTMLRSHKEAVQLALEEGESRKGRGRGYGNGFRPIFAGLADMNGHLRFRSGDHVLVIDGRFNLMSKMVAQKAPLQGFLASVSCVP